SLTSITSDVASIVSDLRSDPRVERNIASLTSLTGTVATMVAAFRDDKRIDTNADSITAITASLARITSEVAASDVGELVSASKMAVGGVKGDTDRLRTTILVLEITLSAMALL